MQRLVIASDTCRRMPPKRMFYIGGVKIKIQHYTAKKGLMSLTLKNQKKYTLKKTSSRTIVMIFVVIFNNKTRGDTYGRMEKYFPS